MKIFLIVLLLFPSVITPTAAQYGNDSAETDILEAIFRHQIGRCYKDRAPQTYFLSYKKRDPSETLMARFQGDRPRVRTRSQMLGYNYKQTGEHSIVLSIGNLEWINDHSVTVTGSCIGAVLDAYSYEYRVVRRQGKWTVVRRKLTGFS